MKPQPLYKWLWLKMWVPTNPQDWACLVENHAMFGDDDFEPNKTINHKPSITNPKKT